LQRGHLEMEVEIRDLREGNKIIDVGNLRSWEKERAGQIIIGDILSITRRKGESNILMRLDSGYTIEMSSSPIGQVLAGLKLGDKSSEQITLVEDEALVVADVRLKEQIIAGNIINCYVNVYSDGHLFKLELDTGYSITLVLNQDWLDKICREEK